MQSRILSFIDPDDYQARIQAGQTEILTSGRGEFQAELTHLRFERLWMQRGADSLSRTARTTIDAARAAVMFVTDLQQGPTILGGHELAPGLMTVYGKGTTNIGRTEGNSQWGSMSLAHEDLARMGEALCGRELTCPSDTHLIRPPAEAMRRLQSVHARAIDAARGTPGVLANPAAAKALEHELVQGLIACLGASASQERSISRNHARIVDRFQAFLESRAGEPVYLAEICSAVGVSERSLRNCCQEMLGVGPVRYLWLRRMHLARQALLHEDATGTTVTKVATDQGFWELGRFSVEYRALFGEKPSATLQRPSDRKAPRSAFDFR